LLAIVLAADSLSRMTWYSRAKMQKCELPTKICAEVFG
jgi:hypothetical protein